MRDVISRGLATDNEEVMRLASFAMTCLGALQDNDKLYREEELLSNIKDVRFVRFYVNKTTKNQAIYLYPITFKFKINFTLLQCVLKQELHSDRMLRELKGLKNVKEVLLVFNITFFLDLLQHF